MVHSMMSITDIPEMIRAGQDIVLALNNLLWCYDSLGYKTDNFIWDLECRVIIPFDSARDNFCTFNRTFKTACLKLQQTNLVNWNNSKIL